jgi:hypothetical protein
MIFSDLHDTPTITGEAHVVPDRGAYDMIAVREIVIELGIINLKEETLDWDDVIIPMKPETANLEKHFHIATSIQIDDATNCIKRIFDSKYKPAYPHKIVLDSIHLLLNEQQALHVVLNKTQFGG